MLNFQSCSDFIFKSWNLIFLLAVQEHRIIWHLLEIGIASLKRKELKYYEDLSISCLQFSATLNRLIHRGNPLKS